MKSLRFHVPTLAALALAIASLAPIPAGAYDAETWVLRRAPVETLTLPGESRLAPLGPGGAKRVGGDIRSFPSGLGEFPTITLEVLSHPCAIEGKEIPFEVSRDGPRFVIEWDKECVFPGDSIVVYTTTTATGARLQIENAFWEDASGSVFGAIQVEVLQCTDRNLTPAFLRRPPSCGRILDVPAGEKLTFTVAAFDSNARDDVELSVSGLPSGAVMVPALPATDNPVSSELSWIPSDADTGDHVVVFTATDPCGASAVCRVTIRVVGANQPPDCRRARGLDPEIWPPNHKMVPVRIGGVSDPDGDRVRIMATGVTQDEPTGGRCDALIVDGTAYVRAERLGSGNGRVYTVSFVAADGNGGRCRGQVKVCVPHDRGRGRSCVDDGLNEPSLCGTSDGAIELEGGATPIRPVAADLKALGPARSTGAVEFSLPEDADVRLEVFDIAGRRVATLVNARRTAGTHRLSWETGGLARGMYFYRLRAGDVALTKSALVLE